MNTAPESDAIHLAPYDHEWPASFASEAARLRAAIPADIGCSIEHVGSTAVPGLEAKPVIDIIVVVPDRARWNDLIHPIEELGYEYWRDNPDVDRQLYVKGRPPAGTGRTHHVHVRVPADAVRELRFRDLLLADASLRERYVQLKRSLAEQHRLDRDAYTDGKTAFIEAAMRSST